MVKINLINSSNNSSSKKLSGILPQCQSTSKAQEIADKCELIFITTPDHIINKIVESIKWNKKNTVIHCSGATSLSSLNSIENFGGKIGAFHPLQTFPQKNLPQNILQGITFAIDSRSSINDLLKSIAKKLSCKTITLDPKDRALYHASATMACGFITSIINLSIQMWKDFPGGKENALESLEPLIQTPYNPSAEVFSLDPPPRKSLVLNEEVTPTVSGSKSIISAAWPGTSRPLPGNLKISACLPVNL